MAGREEGRRERGEDDRERNSGERTVGVVRLRGDICEARLAAGVDGSRTVATGAGGN